MHYHNLFNAMQTLAAYNETTATEADFIAALAGFPRVATELAALDTYVATLNQEQMECLIDGCYDEETDLGYIVLHAAPHVELLHAILDEMFMVICG